jgi:hypothetical protein
MLTHGKLIEAYSTGKVIDPYPPGYLSMPGLLPTGLSDVKNPLLAVLIFAAAKPLYFLRLAGMKTWHFFLHARPYYSDIHNSLMLLALVPCYILAACGLASRTEYPAEKAMLVSICLFQALIVAMTWADYDGRHLLAILPIVFIFAARGTCRAWEAGRGLLRASARANEPLS